MTSALGSTLSTMTNHQEHLITEAIKVDQLWISRAGALLEPGVDCSSITDAIARAQHDHARALRRPGSWRAVIAVIQRGKAGQAS